MLKTEAGKMKAEAAKKARVTSWLENIRPGETATLDWSTGVELAAPKRFSQAAAAFLGGAELNIHVGAGRESAIQVIHDSFDDGSPKFSAVIDTGFAAKLGVSLGYLDGIFEGAAEVGGGGKRGFKLDFHSSEDVTAFMQSLVTGEGVLETWSTADYILSTRTGSIRAAVGVELSNPITTIVKHDLGFGLPQVEGKEFSIFSQEDGEISAEADLEAEFGLSVEGSRTWSSARNAHESSSTTETWGKLSVNYALPPVSTALDKVSSALGFTPPARAMDVEVKQSTETRFTEGVMSGITRSRGVTVNLGAVASAARAISPQGVAVGLASVLPNGFDLSSVAPDVLAKLRDLGADSMTYYVDYDLKSDVLLNIHTLRQRYGARAEKSIAKILADSTNYTPTKVRVMATDGAESDRSTPFGDSLGVRVKRYASGTWEAPVMELDLSDYPRLVAEAA
jgi:hypothetical protein